jgi:predicted metal-dependent peptidase
MTNADRLIKIRAKLMSKHRGIASMLLNLPLIEDDSIETMCTDGTCIRWNNKFIEDHLDDELGGVLIHEASHVIWEHPVRKGKRNHKLWNVATDYAINWWLDKQGIPLPEGGLLDYKFASKSAEEIYRELHQEKEEEYEEQKSMEDENVSDDSDSDTDTGNSPNIDQSIDDYIDATTEVGIGEVTAPTDKDGKELTGVALNEVRQQIKEIITQSAKIDKLADSNSAMSKLVADKNHVAQDWREILTDYFLNSNSEDKSWKRSERRFIWQNNFLPSRDNSDIQGKLAVAIDTSGSMSQHELDCIAKEIQHIASEVGINQIKVCYCDHVVRKNTDTDEWWDDYDLDCGDELNLQLRGGGGTEFDPVFNLLNEYTDDKDEIDCLIYFTDTYGDVSDESDPNIPVIWANTSDYGKYRHFNPSFGDIINVDLSDLYA